MKNEFVRKTVLIGAFCFIYGLASVLLGAFLFQGTQDQPVYIISGIGLMIAACWFIFDQLC